ncbi:hypothetical protein [Sinisalibacter aestuarii]|uniref:GlsB/YeaQ/YmgE family stress response membrane protein n=1 Tax=Sinisalibacter aestuarii TaxID=2949426 RepID=A0ABQ5LMG6_9RHOB|nr:hypothetical protein [Sinisalibacter aestuarii]GKY86207.1 hypothetical protein STA1M1_00760 [Sinisalibacter aestuarii]
MTIIISLIVGFGLAWLINYAITFRTGKGRNFAVCIIGGLIGGAVIPWLLHVPNVWTAIIGSAIGVVVLLWITLRVTARTA